MRATSLLVLRASFALRVGGCSRFGINKSKFLISEVRRYEIWGQISGSDWQTAAMRPRQGMEFCQIDLQAQRTKLHSTHPRKNGYCRLPHQKSRKKESLCKITERVCIWSASGTSTLLSWWPWGHRGVPRRWWRPTARCKREKKRRYMSKNWTYSSRFCFLKKLPQFFLSGSSVRITTHKKRQEHWLQCIKLCAIRRPGLSTSSSISSTRTSAIVDVPIPQIVKILSRFLTRSSWSEFLRRFVNRSLSNTPICTFSVFFLSWDVCSTRKKWKYEWRASEKPAAKIRRNNWRLRRSTKRYIAWIA